MQVLEEVTVACLAPRVKRWHELMGRAVLVVDSDAGVTGKRRCSMLTRRYGRCVLGWSGGEPTSRTNANSQARTSLIKSIVSAGYVLVWKASFSSVRRPKGLKRRDECVGR